MVVVGVHGAACLVFVIIVAQLLDVGSKKPVTPANKVANPAESTTSEATIALPLVSDVPADDSVAKEDPNFRADQLVFSQIYQKPTTTWSLDILTNKAQAVNLPINIKKMWLITMTSDDTIIWSPLLIS